MLTPLRMLLLLIMMGSTAMAVAQDVNLDSLYGEYVTDDVRAQLDKFKELGYDLANRIQGCKDQMFIGSLQEIHDLHEELLPYRALLEKLPLETKTRFATHFRRADFLYAIATKMEELVAVPDNELESHVNREFPAISEENFKTIEMMVRLRKMELYIHEMSNLPGAQECEDYKLKVEEIGRYLASIRPIVGRKVTASYRRKLGLG